MSKSVFSDLAINSTHMAAGAGYYPPSLEKKSYAHTYTDQTLFHIRVEELDNGYLVYVEFRGSENPKRIYIKDFTELTGAIAAQLAVHRMGVCGR